MYIYIHTYIHPGIFVQHEKKKKNSLRFPSINVSLVNERTSRRTTNECGRREVSLPSVSNHNCGGNSGKGQNAAAGHATQLENIPEGRRITIHGRFFLLSLLIDSSSSSS